MSRPSRSRTHASEPTAHVDLEYPSSVPTFTVNPSQLSSSSTPLPWFSAFGRKDNDSPLPSEIDPKYSDPAYYASSSTYGKNGRNTSHTAKKPEGHIKRPPNCFLLFRSHVKESGIRIPDALKPILKERLREKRREQKAKSGARRASHSDDDDDEDDDDNDDDEQSVSKISGILWDFLPAAEKSLFRARAAHAKSQHKKLYPNYKYSPQVKDKTVKRRVGKKMPTEKRERLEEVAGVLVREMGWATGDISVKRSGTPASSSSKAAPEVPPPSASDMPGTSAFGVPGYEHHPHNKTGSAPPPHFDDADNMGVPMGVDPSTPYGMPRMERRTSSCPPPNAHLTWGQQQLPQPQPQSQTPPVFGGALNQNQMYPQPPQPQQQWTYPAPPQPQNYAFVRPGGKTARKMRTAPGTAKAQILNGSGRSSSRKATVPPPETRPTPTIEVPTLPKVSTDVPMTTGTVPSAYDDSAWGLGMPYDQSQHSSPQTISSSAPPSVLLETPPFHGQFHPQPVVNHPGQGAGYDFAAAQAAFDSYQMPPPPPQSFQYSHSPLALSTKADEVVGDNGELGLTLIDQNYTFPPMQPGSPTASGSPRSGSPPRAPSQRDEAQRKWTKNQLAQGNHSPLGKQAPNPRKAVARLNASPPPPPPAQPDYNAAPPPQVVSPTPVHHQTLDTLGVDFNLTIPSDGQEPGPLEFHFPGHNQAAPSSATEVYSGLLGGANPHVLLGDVALGMHHHQHQDEQQQQQYYHPHHAAPEEIDPLYSADGSGLLGATGGVAFDPSTYIADLSAAAAAEEMQMTSTQQLEYEMMQWRRGSENPNPSTGTAASADGRRPSISLGMALGNDVGVALYGYDAQPYEYTYGPAEGQLGTVPEERERGSSEEAEAFHGQQQQQQHQSQYGSWVASNA